MIFAASPLTTIALAAATIVMTVTVRDLPGPERRRLLIILAIALGARFAFIAAVMISGIPFLNDLSVGALQGDDAYYVARAIRARDIMLA